MAGERGRCFPPVRWVGWWLEAELGSLLLVTHDLSPDLNGCGCLIVLLKIYYIYFYDLI
jgi:hypothetical protein